MRPLLFRIVIGLPLATGGCAGSPDATSNEPSVDIAGGAPPAASSPSSTGEAELISSYPTTPGYQAIGAAANAVDQTAAASSSSFRRTQRQRLHEKLLFYPLKYPEGNWFKVSLPREEVTFTASDGTRLGGWFVPCESPKAVVLYAHGNAGNVTSVVEALEKLHALNVAVLAFDYRGYGRSEGKPTVAGVLDDARSARAWLARRAGIPEANVVLMGRSLGGAVVVQLARQLPPRGLVIESSFSSLREIADHHFSKLSWLVPRDELNSVAAMGFHEGPLLVSHGDADRTIPPEHGLKLYNAMSLKVRGPKQFFTVAGGDHNDPQPEEYYRRLDRFLADLP